MYTYLRFLYFNNYYNRIVKKYDTLAEYDSYTHYDYDKQVSFNPGDGINTYGIETINWSENWIPDYLIEYSLDQQNNPVILSRWFILEMDRTKSGQYKLQLHRDVMADNKDIIVNVPTFIEKATVADSDPAIFNNEDMSFNQIKTEEYLLKDRTDCAWLVGYYNENLPESVPINFGEDDLDREVYETLTTTIDNWRYYNYNASNPFYGYITNMNYHIHSRTFSGYWYDYQINGNTSETTRTTEPMTNRSSLVGDPSASRVQSIFADYGMGSLRTLLESEIGSHSYDTENDLYQYNGKLIKDANNNYYDIIIDRVPAPTTKKDITSGTLYTTLTNLATTIEFAGQPNENTFKVDYECPQYIVRIVQRESKQPTFSLPLTANALKDAPYKMIAIPYVTKERFFYRGGEHIPSDININKEIAARLLNKRVTTEEGEDPIALFYDFQLLPYCPIDYLRPAPSEYDGLMLVGSGYEEGVDYSYVKDGNDNILSVVFYPRFSQFSTRLTLDEIAGLDDELKVQNECNSYRLCSPNYNGQFEFSAAKNGGINGFDVDCTYKPYSPYIHVAPDFGRLYGRDFDDARGLICGGDFSLTQTTNAWAEYQLQNKNYENIFGRQIEHLETNNNIQLWQDILTAAAGTISGTAAGGIAGSMMPSMGMGIGAGIGAGASLLGGIGDVITNQELRNEALDYTRDNYGYQLGNIKAMPYSLSKVSAINANNKIYPFLEYYTCTDIEKDALRDKIKYNGMTVMRIGKISDFLKAEPTYIKGKLIRCEDLADDYRMVSVIAEELNKGVFI